MQNIADTKDKATREATAFQSWAELMRSVRLHGYVPTLSRGSARQAALGLLLELEGVRVFWVGGRRHAA